jgi:cysteinyl-tRNA synthetase
VHNEFLDFAGEKMSKSKGNVLTLSDLPSRGIDPMAFRYFFLQAHYRQQQTFTQQALEAAATGYRRLQGAAAELRQVEGEGDPDKLPDYRDRFRAALCDDLNAPKALAVLWELVRSDDGSPADRRDSMLALDAVLGLGLDRAEAPEQKSESDPRIDGLLVERQQARENRDFATADRIRDDLDAEGIDIIDTPEGPRWRRR